MTGLISVLLCAGPLTIAALSLLGMGAAVGIEQAALQVCGAVVAVQLCAITVTAVLYRWCFSKPPARGASLLAALLVSLFFLSYPPLLSQVGAILGAPLPQPRQGAFLALLLVDGLTLVGLASVACMFIVLLIELPLRWVQGDWPMVSDGTFRAARALLVILTVAVASALIRDEGVDSLVELFRRALT
jgi:hypothetical protein